MKTLSNVESLVRKITDRIIQLQEATPSDTSYLELSYIFEQIDKLDKAKYVLQEGIQEHPNSIALHRALWSLYTKQKQQQEKIKYIPRVLKSWIQKRPIKFFDRLQGLLLQTRQYELSLSITQLQLRKFPQQIDLLYDATQKSLNLGYYKEAISYLETIKELVNDTDEIIRLNMKIGMVYILSGDFEEGEKQFTYCREEYNDLLPEIYKDGYEKLVIFNNGESSIEYYKNICSTKRVVATFDSIDKTNKAKPFAFSILKKKSVDLISLRRRTVDNYHQDLSREEYYQTIEKLVLFYEKRFAYGTSLGGYCSLYFGSTIPECKILSLAPRNSAHPNYGSKIRGNSEFTHSLSHPVNTEVEPIICYDPKERIDQHYITEEIQKSYPNATFKYFYYAGHRVPLYLQQVGVLKDIVSRFLAEEPIPNYSPKLHSKSAEYHRILALACKRDLKLRWSLDLVNKSVELAPTYDRSLALRIEVLLSLKQFDTCIEYAKEAIKIHPNLARFYILLADAYISKDELYMAIDILESARKKTKSKKIVKKLKSLKKQTEYQNA
ncbi:tetratricopeptide repeat protein [Rummeliibacillus sp. TYF005]|uniref:tetratricopeptide repeat protein n=1 Tax=Rummeliibacillus sp. TYF005 TaxID=2058214 RepID=UPI000F5351F4|nr:tetratricopeptide repeat protein [Rummeliibacillus sp. TYF005]RPJ95385.1 tetratricopeptide repeat protein [Rummeliibacillus sp. TYF005]